MNIMVSMELGFWELFEYMGTEVQKIMKTMSAQGKEEPVLQCISENFHVSGWDEAKLLPDVCQIDEFIRLELENRMKMK